jgi:NarL family two-component system sensor histidine kinase LiaS
MNNERVTLAQELHDGIAQDLVVLGFSIDQAISQSHETEVKKELRKIRFTTTQLIENLREQMHQLRSGDPLEDSSVPVDTMHETLRVVQEILRNIEKHAGATKITIDIADNGQGGVTLKENSFGLRGLQERVTRINGEIHIETSSKGTKIGVTIPLDG